MATFDPIEVVCDLCHKKVIIGMKINFVYIDGKRLLAHYKCIVELNK